MNIRLYNARILTMEKHKEAFDGEIWVKNDRIALVNTKEEIDKAFGPDMPKPYFDVELDCEGNLLMPGFKNAHTHSPMTFLRSLADDMPLDRWLNEKIFPNEEKLTDEAIYRFTRLAVLEYLESGITSVFDMYIRPDVTAKAFMDLGMRGVLVSGVNNFTSSVEQTEEEYLRLNKIHPLISYQIGFHAEYTTDKSILYKLSQLSHRYRAPVYMHLSETKKEVEDCKQRTGMSPVVYLDSMGLFEFGGGGFHCVHMSEEDMEIFRRRRLHVITNPSSNMKLASGIAPVAEMDRRKIPVSIGTDGAASNNCLDMFREMFLVAGLSKLKEENAESMPANRVLRMATVHGAKAMGLAKCDTLTKGKQADIIMIDLKAPNMRPLHNIEANLVYSGNKKNVLMTMIAGKILYYKNEYNLGVSKEEIYRGVEEALHDIGVCK